MLPWTNRPRDPGAQINESKAYGFRVLSVDWGGGGKTGLSLTAAAMLGHRGDGRIDVVYGKKLMTPYDQIGEAEECKDLMDLFRCNLLAHDYTGSGILRETFLIQAGLPMSRDMPIQYVRSSIQDL